jgi:3',5'-cyclic AMP phosphodiesterase CpdA
MKIAQISDLHIAAKGKTLGVAPMAENLAAVVAHVNAMRPDLVLVSGDIAHDSTLVETRRAAALLDALTAPYYVTPGNHDDRAVMRQVFGGAAMPAAEAGHTSYCIETPALSIIMLDSSDPDAPHGRICPARAQWLEERLAAGSKPALLVMHHPPVKFAVEESDHPPMEGAALLAAVVDAHPRIARILCGHIHLNAQALWHGVLVCAAPSIGMRLSWTPDAVEPSRFFTAPPAYLWHMENADGQWITHGFSLDGADGPFAFS